MAADRFYLDSVTTQTWPKEARQAAQDLNDECARLRDALAEANRERDAARERCAWDELHAVKQKSLEDLRKLVEQPQTDTLFWCVSEGGNGFVVCCHEFRELFAAKDTLSSTGLADHLAAIDRLANDLEHRRLARKSTVVQQSAGHIRNRLKWVRERLSISTEGDTP